MINFNKSLKYILYDFLKLPLKIPTSDDMAIKLYPEYEKYYDNHLMFYLKEDLIFKIWLKKDKDKDINEAIKDVDILVR